MLTTWTLKSLQTNKEYSGSTKGEFDIEDIAFFYDGLIVDKKGKIIRHDNGRKYKVLDIEHHA